MKTCRRHIFEGTIFVVLSTGTQRSITEIPLKTSKPYCPDHKMTGMICMIKLKPEDYMYVFFCEATDGTAKKKRGYRI